MMNDAKENYMGHLSCKSHTARTEKDFYRICPSKLSKRELEDLYFALLEENVQLKKTSNEQRDQIKVLNTRVQRMTVQKPVGGFHNRDCCAGNKAIINEQKESIADLKKANERLSERLRLLNMRLCSAKQFLRRGCSQAPSHCTKCPVSSASIKNSSMSALNTKRSDTKLRMDTPPCQIAKDNIPLPLAEIDIPTQLAEVTSSQAEIHRPSYGPGPPATCQRNECRTEIDELKLKILVLEEEVCTVRRSHSERMRMLEAEACSRAARLSEELRGTRCRTDELWTQLRLQRARESEQSARRRDDRVNGDLCRAEASLTNRSLPLCDAIEMDPPEPVPVTFEDRTPIVVPNNSGISLFVEEKSHKNSDDSGFTECLNRDLGDEKERERDDQIDTQIANLQSQLSNSEVEAVGSQAEQPSTSLGAESSLSHDIFSTSRFKTVAAFDKVPSTSCEPDVLLSTDRVIDEFTRSPEKTEKYGRDFKYHIPGPLSLDMPKMSLGDNAADNKLVDNERINKNVKGERNSKASVKINLDKIEQMNQELLDGDKRTIIDSGDGSNHLLGQMIEGEKANNDLKKNRRSSLKTPYERKQSRDIAVRYGQKQTYKTSAETESNAKNVPRGTDMDKVYVDPDEDHESDPSVQYKVNDRVSIRRIRYMNDVQTDPYTEPEQKRPGLDNGTRSVGADRLDNDVGIQCLRDLAPRGSCEVERTGSHLPKDEVIKETTAKVADVGSDSPVLCAGLSRVCDCSPGPAPAPVALRTCSGGVAPPPLAPQRYRTCACLQYPPPPSPPPPRPASSERTDGELSSLTDPTLTHDPVPSDYISPGEEKATSTLSESYNTTDFGSLSEGEVPCAAGGRLSTTEDKMTEAMRESRSVKMDEALRAIGEELTRCRELLQGKGGELTESVHSAESKSDSHLKPAAQPSPRSSLGLPGRGSAEPLTLRRAGGSCRMRDAYAPKCIFTLHVGTLVLSDQAATCSRGCSLLARWCFYRQPPGDTRALKGRVINYDCTAHYDNVVTEHFLYYLKHEEMPIIISEMDKQDEEFATCALPLRDALLHPNRRVDMSLALVPGGGSGEEAGVLDVWCSLRVDASALPAINSAIVKPSSMRTQHHSSSMLDQILDDDQSIDYRFSKDLHRRRSKGASEDNQSYHSGSLDGVPELSRSCNEVIEDEVPTNIRSVNDFKQAVAKKSNDSTSIYEMLKNKKLNRRSIVVEGTFGSQKAQDGGRHKSVTISNHPSCTVDRRDISQTAISKVSSQSDISAEENLQSLDITILWLALNEDCAAMSDPLVKRLYVAYSFLGRGGAYLETPTSLPKPKHYMDKCHFLFKRTFAVSDCDMPSLCRLARSVPAAGAPDPTRAVVFSVVSEPDDDPLGLNSCEDIGYAYLYLGEVLSRCTGPSFTAVLEVRDARRAGAGGGAGVGCGALAVRLDGLALLRRCQERAGPPVSVHSVYSLI